MSKQINFLALALLGVFALMMSPSSAGVLTPHVAIVESGMPGLLWNVDVVCEQRREGNSMVTYSCPDGNTCFSDAGQWKCRGATAAPMSCGACLRNQQRDSNSCTRSGDLISQNQCINRVNAEYLKCIPGCTSP